MYMLCTCCFYLIQNNNIFCLNYKLIRDPASPDAKLGLDTLKVAFYRTTDKFNVNIPSFDKSGPPETHTIENHEISTS